MPDTRTRIHSDAAALQAAFDQAYRRVVAHSADAGTAWGAFRAAALACRDELAARWLDTQAEDRADGAPRRVHYMSMEFLTGRMLANALDALGLHDALSHALGRGVALSDVLESEAEPGLGNGGLGRLAACFLDAFATLGVPSFGYGVRYEYGMFSQAIDAAGRQVEHPDHWTQLGNPWEIERPELRYVVGFGGHVATHGEARRWQPEERAPYCPSSVPAVPRSCTRSQLPVGWCWSQLPSPLRL